MAQKHNNEYIEKPMTTYGPTQGPSRRYRRLRHPTFLATEWTAKNPLLQRGEIGAESDTHKIKVGDGITYWNDLPYTYDDVGANTDLSNLTATGKANISALGTYNESNTYNAGTVGKALQGKLNLDGTNTMTGVLKMRASISFQCAIAPYWDGVGFYKLNDNDSVTLMASMESTQGFTPFTTNTYDIGMSSKKWKNLYLAGKVFVGTINNGADITIPATSGTMALTSDIITYTGSDGITLTGTNFTNSGVRSVASGTANGTISVNTNGTSADVSVTGLGSAAYTASSDYATAAQGTLASTAVQPGDLATVATTGDYDDLLNKPTIPAAQVNSDWNATSGVAQILNKPTLGTMAAESANDYTPTSGLATVATTGNYSDLSGTPTIPAAQVNSDWNAVSGVAEILNKPTTLGGYGITDGADTSLSNITSAGKQVCANMAMPSTTDTTITPVPVSGGTMIAPADGYFVARATALAIGNYLELIGGGMDSLVHSGGGSLDLAIFIPVQKGMSVTTYYSTNTPSFKFIYANGTA